LQILTAEGMTFNHIVRQWNYVGNILHREQKNNSLHQHYQLFNEVRNNYYSKYRTVGNFPAATGIGTAHEGMAIDICAAKIPDELRLSSLNSPIQVEPYLYSQKVLIGSPKINKTAPQFERAKILMNNHYSTVYISGTASIIGQKTIGIDDVQEQTRLTIQNIESLVGSGNLQNHALFPTEVNLSREFKYIRVYVKKSGDIPAVKKICTQHFGNTPALYVQSDICRDDLLVEIEGELLLKTI
jgi:enamine deaminase RidA (YjgF/YER057c/UK114 family)